MISQRPARGPSFGYTMVETIIVMLLVVILSAFVFININSSLNANRLNSAAAKLAADLRYAQTLATGAGGWYGVSYSADPVNQYSVFEAYGTGEVVIENPGSFGSSLVVNVKNDYDVLIASAVIGAGTKVYFNAFGAPYLAKDGALLTTEGVITLTKGALVKTVRISANTGRIFIQ